MLSYLGNTALEELRRQCGLSRPDPGPVLAAALNELDREIASLAGRLRVEYYGPGVGTDRDAESVYRLVVRAHAWALGEPVWGVRVCDATEGANWRAMWTLGGVGRLRQRRLLSVLPAFLTGYAQTVAASPEGESPSAEALSDIARAVAG